MKTGEDFEASSGMDDRLTDGIHRDSLYGGELFFEIVNRFFAA